MFANTHCHNTRINLVNVCRQTESPTTTQDEYAGHKLFQRHAIVDHDSDYRRSNRRARRLYGAMDDAGRFPGKWERLAVRRL